MFWILGLMTRSSLYGRPGYLIRRAQQIAVSLFMEECAPFGITPVQYGVLRALKEFPHSEQTTVSLLVGLDRSTTADVVTRLEERGLIERDVGELDRRTKVLRLTPQGESTLDHIEESVQRAQERILAPLTEQERQRFMALLTKLVDANNETSRVPQGIDRKG